MNEFVAPGYVGYWEPEKRLCLFFGPTPESPPGTIKPDSPVIIVGRIISPVYAIWIEESDCMASEAGNGKTIKVTLQEVLW